MTEATATEPTNSNGFKEKCNDNDKLANRSSTRPTGIPRLLPSCAHKCNDIDIVEEKNIHTRIPVSPSKRNPPRPKSIGSYAKSPCQDRSVKDIVSPNYSKRSSRDIFFSHNIHTEPRPRTAVQSLNRHDRAMSEENHGRKSVESSFSEKTNNSGSTGGFNCVITSKIGSLANARHVPGGGKVTIFEDKLDFSNVESRCGSKKNIKHKPGGGVVEIVNRKVEFSQNAEPKVNSLKNIKHQPQGGVVKIENRKLEWNTTSKVGSMHNMKHKPGGGDVQIISQPLPWLKFNRPNLPPEEVAKIHKKCNKESLCSPSRSHSNSQCSENS